MTTTMGSCASAAVRKRPDLNERKCPFLDRVPSGNPAMRVPGFEAAVRPHCHHGYAGSARMTPVDEAGSGGIEEGAEDRANVEWLLWR